LHLCYALAYMEVQKWFDISGLEMDMCKRVAAELRKDGARLEAFEHNEGWGAPGRASRQAGGDLIDKKRAWIL
jgi:hypothetical protein